MEKAKITNSEVQKINQLCIGHRVRLINRVLTNIYDDALKGSPINANQMNLLVVIMKIGPISPGELAKRMQMEKSTLSRNIERIKKHGWLELLSKESKRSHQLKISEKGKEVLHESMPAWKKAQKEAGVLLGKEGTNAVCQAGDFLWNG